MARFYINFDDLTDEAKAKYADAVSETQEEAERNGVDLDSEDVGKFYIQVDIEIDGDIFFS